MKKLTIKQLQEKIEQLEEIKSNQLDEIINLNNKIIDLLARNEKLEGLIRHTKKHNERNAGRKSIVSEDLIANVHKLKNENMTMQQISNTLKISVGLVHKILKSPQGN